MKRGRLLSERLTGDKLNQGGLWEEGDHYYCS